MTLNEFSHVDVSVRQYLDGWQSTEDDLQRAMRRQAAADGKEHWLIPPEVGRLLTILCKTVAAGRVFEVGSYLGYSATWILAGLAQDGQLVLTETDDGRFRQALAFLGQSPEHRDPRIHLHHGDGVDRLLGEAKPYDLILIDHDKPDYVRAFEVAKGRVRAGGMIVADNLLWRGRILQAEWAEDPSTAGVLAYNHRIFADPDVSSVIIPIGDGVGLSVRH